MPQINSYATVTPAAGDKVIGTDATDGSTKNFDVAAIAALASGGSGATTLDGLTDVNAPSPSPGQVLKWSGTAWINDNDNTSGGGGAPMASPTTTGTVKIDSANADPVVYRSATIDTLLAAKAATTHTHAIADTTGLQSALDGKAATSHTHTIANVTNLQPTLDGKAATAHTHAIADTTGLQAALDAKSASTHTHPNATTSAAGFMSAADKTKLDASSLEPYQLNWSTDGATHIIFVNPATISAATERGTGVLAYAKAVAADPATFTGVTLPQSFAAGDELRVTASGVTGIKRVALSRSA